MKRVKSRMITVSHKLPKSLLDRLKAEARRRRTARAVIVREALEAHLRNGDPVRRPTVYDLTKDLCGKFSGGPRDLSYNKKHLEGFGT